MFRRLILAILVVFLLLAAALMTTLFVFRHPTPARFQSATTGQSISLPRDEAAHFDVQTEWWYYTGFVTGEGDQRHSFELVFFKAYVPEQVQIGGVLPISWIANPLYFAHLAVSDLSAQEHVFFERANVPRFWDAGARTDHFEVWNGGWRAWAEDDQHHLRAGAGRYRLRLDLAPAKPPALHGPEGLGVVDMGQAGQSYYYSYTDLEGVGFLWVDGVRHPVQATAWMDHQWGSWDMHGGFDGWDWFSLRLDDGTDLMLFAFRDEEGGHQPESAGTWIAADGSTELAKIGRTQHLPPDEFNVEVLEHWTSPDTGARYPVRWHLTIPGHDVDATVAATFPEQEMTIELGPIYWEGSVTVEGSVGGVGFVEMTGYAP